MDRLAHQTLSHPHHLDLAGHTDRPLARAVLAGDLADPGVHPERLECIDHETGDEPESRLDPGLRLRLRQGQGKGDRGFVKNGGPPAREAFHGVESVRSGGAHRRSVSGGHSICSPERHHRPGEVEPKGGIELTCRHRGQDRVAYGHVECTWSALPNQSQRIHPIQHTARDNEPLGTTHRRNESPGALV